MLFGTPLLGALALGIFGARRWAPELNVAVSLITFLAACALTAHVVSEGPLLVAHEQFFIDPFNVFLVTLTALVGLTTSLFSRPYMRVEMDHGRVSAQPLFAVGLRQDFGSTPMKKAPRERDRPIDPNSPFAKLAALKEQLAANRKD